jgi:hypothetical protein
VAAPATNQPPTPAVLAEIQDVIHKAKQGDATVLPRLHELLTEYPALWTEYGDLAAHAEAAWVTLTAGNNLHLRECLLRQAAALRDELAGPAPSPVERLLVGRVVACWLQLHYFDTMEAQAGLGDESPRLARYRARRQEQAHRMYLSALAALTTLRRLLPATTKVVQPVERNGCTTPQRNGYDRNGHAAPAPPDVANRISDFFEREAEESEAELIGQKGGAAALLG